MINSFNILQEHTLAGFEYDKPHRHYHTSLHIYDMLDKLENYKDRLTKQEIKELELTIVYHDVVYDINRSISKDKKVLSNEKMSAKFFVEKSGKKYDKEITKKVVKLIEMTGTPEKAKTFQEKLLMFLDFNTILEESKSLRQDSYNIFKEYQVIPYETFQDGRREFCQKIGPKIIEKTFKDDKDFGQYYEGFLNGFKTLELINECFRPKIGIYVGSFKPFHIGHFNILKKAEKIFDKVVIVSAVNDSKENLEPSNIPYYLETEIERNNQLITNTIKKVVDRNKCFYETSLIRGIRNNSDLISEQNYNETLQDFGNQIPIVHILSDSKYTHISSSLIRELSKMEDENEDIQARLKEYLKFF